MLDRFSLVLVANHACNLRCSYCYTGAKFSRAMLEAFGRRGIDRAVASLHRGGRLDLGFFGGEPLLEARRILGWIEYARSRTGAAGARLAFSLTTNGTVADGEAWAAMTLDDLALAVSHDGLPEVHDRHRRTADGRGTSDAVLRTMDRLREAGKDFRVVSVVRPDGLRSLSEGVAFLRSRGVLNVDLSLDLWTPWTPEDVSALEEAVARCADLWRDGLPGFGIGWFDAKAAELLGVPGGEKEGCGFGVGEVAVAPSGNLYPCERVVGEDRPSNPLRLPGHVTDTENFLGLRPAPERSDPGCAACALQSLCETTCRCSNFVRTGRVDHPDGLLCRFEQACLRETARALGEIRRASPAGKISARRCA